MSRLRDTIAELYARDPAAAVRFVNRTNRLVRVGKHWWRGYKRLAGNAAVVTTVDGQAVDDAALTRQQWKLIPDALHDEFLAFERAVDEVLRLHCLAPPPRRAGSDDDAPEPLVFGNGVYGVDAARWPRVEKLLADLQGRWDAAADRWCTADGYAELHRLLAAKNGPAVYALTKDLVPPADVLRGKFRLEVRPLAWRLAEEVGSPAEEAARFDMVLEAVEAAVRGPREEAARVWRDLADQLADAAGAARRPLRKSRTGAMVASARTVTGDSVRLARRVTDALAKSERTLEPDSRARADDVRAELPAEVDAARAAAKKWNADDAAAERVAKILRGAAAVVADEAAMCAGLAAALDAARRAAAPTTPEGSEG